MDDDPQRTLTAQTGWPEPAARGASLGRRDLLAAGARIAASTVAATLLGGCGILQAAIPAAPGNLVFNGDFEIPSDQSPPPGWRMWGPARDKVPADYTRDTSIRHGGLASLRIFHPAGSDGYIVTSPTHAIRPRPNTVIAVSFWARADEPGWSFFGFGDYSSIDPYRGAPSPAGFPFQVGPSWQRFQFTVREGLDFSAATSRYMLLVFKATSDATLRRTLWIDDVVATETAARTPLGLLDMSTIPHPPLAEPLVPGNSLRVTVDALRRVRPAVALAGGISFHRVAGWTGQPYDKAGHYTLPAALEGAIRALRLPMTRFYGVGAEAFGVEQAIADVAYVLGRVGIPQSTAVLELEGQLAQRAIAPQVWARAARFVVSKGWAFRHWEVANEPYDLSLPPPRAFLTPQDYVSHVKAVSAAIRAVQPQAQIGIDIDSESVAWGNYVLKAAAGSYDFVAAHYYSPTSVFTTAFSDLVISDNLRVLNRLQRINALMRAYNPGRAVYQYDTEWGNSSRGQAGQRPDYVDRNANIIGCIYRAVRLIHYARGGLLQGASSWQLLSLTSGQGFGILFSDAPQARSLLYWLYEYFNRHVGARVLQVTGTAPYHTPGGGQPAGPYTPALVTESADGRRIFLVVANGAWNQAYPATIHIQNAGIGAVEGALVSDFRPGNPMNHPPLVNRRADAVRGLPLTVRGAEVSLELPARSVAFITIAKA